MDVLQKRNIAMMQPAFLPWQGLFELIASADTFIFLDDFQYVLQSHHTRNRLFVNKNAVDYYQVPIQKSKSFEMPLNRAEIVSHFMWRKKILKRLLVNYSKAPFFKEIHPLVENWINQEYHSLAGLNMELIRTLCDVMRIPHHFLYSSDFSKKTNSQAKRSARIAELLEWADAQQYLSAFGSFDYMKEDHFQDFCNIPVLFQNYIPKPYYQIGSDGKFIPYLSVLDALYNIGPQKTYFLILHGTEKWLTWKEREVYNE